MVLPGLDHPEPDPARLVSAGRGQRPERRVRLRPRPGRRLGLAQGPRRAGDPRHDGPGAGAVAATDRLDRRRGRGRAGLAAQPGLAAGHRPICRQAPARPADLAARAGRHRRGLRAGDPGRPRGAGADPAGIAAGPALPASLGRDRAGRAGGDHRGADAVQLARLPQGDGIRRREGRGGQRRDPGRPHRTDARRCDPAAPRRPSPGGRWAATGRPSWRTGRRRPRSARPPGSRRSNRSGSTRGCRTAGRSTRSPTPSSPSCGGPGPSIAACWR